MSAVQVDSELTEWFTTTVGVRQGCGLSPYLFSLILEVMMRMALEGKNDLGVNICGRMVNNLYFADDINVIADNEDDLQRLTSDINQFSTGLQSKHSEDKDYGNQQEGNKPGHQNRE